MSSRRPDVQMVGWKPFHFSGQFGKLVFVSSSALFLLVFLKTCLYSTFTCWRPSCLTELNPGALTFHQVGEQ